MAEEFTSGEWNLRMAQWRQLASKAPQIALAIKSAPELLERLTELTEAVRYISQQYDLSPIRNEYMMRCLTRCEAAIEAAQGELTPV